MQYKNKALNKIRITNIVIAVTLSFTACFFLYVYRPYIYQNEINDFGVADSITNIFGTMTLSFFAAAFFVRPREMNHRRFFVWIVISFSLFFLLWEFAQLRLLSGFYDARDLIGVFISAVSAVLLYNFAHPAKIRKDGIVRIKLK